MCLQYYTSTKNAILPVEIFIGELIKNGLSKDVTLIKCFEVIKDNYGKSASSQEYNSMLCKRNHNNQFSGEGTYYDFNSIPEESWDCIKNYINERIKV